MRWSYRVIAVLCAYAVASLAAAAPLPEKKPLTKEEIDKCETAVKEFLAKKNAAAGVLTLVKDDNLQKQFPRHAAFTLLFRQFPVGRPAPPGFVVSNVILCDADGKIELVTKAQTLSDFFSANAVPGKTDDDAANVARAWMRLNQELHQDGFYKFELMDKATKVVTSGKGTREVSLTVAAMQGGSGTVEATVMFDDGGHLMGTKEAVKLRPGPRPICQATKLLDADPLVRRIAEQDLLIMGTAAKPYLDEQRAKASPELQRAIDVLWQRIVAAER
jgi:hypothetical protein